jgi:hypothetical protein
LSDPENGWNYSEKAPSFCAVKMALKGLFQIKFFLPLQNILPLLRNNQPYNHITATKL